LLQKFDDVLCLAKLNVNNIGAKLICRVKNT